MKAESRASCHLRARTVMSFIKCKEVSTSPRCLVFVGAGPTVLCRLKNEKNWGPFLFFSVGAESVPNLLKETRENVFLIPFLAFKQCPRTGIFPPFSFSFSCLYLITKFPGASVKRIYSYVLQINHNKTRVCVSIYSLTA